MLVVDSLTRLSILLVKEGINMQSFLMIGQSNMAGRGFLQDVPPIYNERIQMLRNGQWQMMTEPINYDRPVSGVGLAASFAESWCQEHQQEQIGLIPCAEGGSSLDDWRIDGPLFRHAITETAFALESSTLAGILWHQGENDSMNSNYLNYYDKFLTIIDALRKELKAENVPLLIGGLGDFLGKQGFGAYATEYQQVNEELKRFAFEQANCCFVTASGLTANPDGIHMDAVSQRKFGLRYFEAFRKEQHVLEPVMNEQDWLKQTTSRAHTKTEKIYMESLKLAQGESDYADFEQQLAAINNEQVSDATV